MGDFAKDHTPAQDGSGSARRGLSAPEALPPTSKECCVSRGFKWSVVSLAELKQAIASYGAKAAAKLNRDQRVDLSLQVFITTNRFRPREPQYANSETLVLPYPTNGSSTLGRAALGATERLYQPGYSYHKAGVLLMDLSPAGFAQGGLFGDESRQERAGPLLVAVDSLNQRFGAGTVRWAAEGGSKSGESGESGDLRGSQLGGMNWWWLGRAMKCDRDPDNGSGVSVINSPARSLCTAINLLTAIIKPVDDAVSIPLPIAMASLSQTFDTTRAEIVAAIEQMRSSPQWSSGWLR